MNRKIKLSPFARLLFENYSLSSQRQVEALVCKNS